MHSLLERRLFVITGLLGKAVRRHRQASIFLAALFCTWLPLGVTSPAVALTLSEDQDPNNGDFSDSSGFVSFATLDEGVNTIIGDTADGGSQVDNDYLLLYIQDNHEMTEILITVSNYSGGTGTASQLQLLANGTGSVEFRGDGVFPIPEFTSFPGFSGFQIGILPGESGSSPDTFSYAVSITTAVVVPEPATALLVALGLAGMTSMAGRRPTHRAPLSPPPKVPTHSRTPQHLG